MFRDEQRPKTRNEIRQRDVRPFSGLLTNAVFAGAFALTGIKPGTVCPRRSAEQSPPSAMFHLSLASHDSTDP
jgi:hypothetical protein